MNMFTKKLNWLIMSMMLMVSGSAWAGEETIDFSDQGYTNGQLVSSTAGTVVTATFTDGGTATAYYDTGTAVRVYNGGTMTVTAGGKTITKVVFEYELQGNATVSVSPRVFNPQSGLIQSLL